MADDEFPPPTIAKWIAGESVNPAPLADELRYWFRRLTGCDAETCRHGDPQEEVGTDG